MTVRPDAIAGVPDFTLFAGIDWSGSKSPRLHGLQVAVCRPGREAPGLLDGPLSGGLWRRGDVLAWLDRLAAEGERVLAGFDFAFGYAYQDQGSYFPGFPGSPGDAPALWELVERLAADGADLYGGLVYAPGTVLSDYYLTPAGRGALYRHRQRRTERACAAVTTPHPVFKCVGAANVGTGSLAGMRLLHRMRDRVGVWPFDRPASTTVVEIFPRFYAKRSGQDPRRWREPGVVDAVLAHHNSDAYSGRPLDTEDRADAVMSAAAIRLLAGQSSTWDAPTAEPAARLEGWIFGVTCDKRGAS